MFRAYVDGERATYEVGQSLPGLSRLETANAITTRGVVAEP